MRTQNLLLPLLILLAGCTGTPATQQMQIEPGIVPDTGVKILYFTPDYSLLYSTDRFRLNIIVQDVGSSRANNINAELHKYGDFNVSGGIQKKVADNLEPPDTQSRSPGETAEAEWQVRVPPTSASFSYNFGVKVKYDYRTESWTDGVVLSRERWKTLNQLGKQIQLGTGTSTGPLQVVVSTHEVVLPKLDVATSSKSFPVQIKLQNTGTGVVNSDGGGCNTQGVGCVDYVYLYVPKGDPVTNFTVDSCTPAFTATSAGDTTLVTFTNVTLMSGSTSYLSCNIITSADLFARPDLEKSFRLKASADYRYQVESETTVMVQGESVKR